MDAEITKMIAISEQIAAQHMDFIKSDGMKGQSAMQALASFEKTEIGKGDSYYVIALEFLTLRVLLEALQDEGERIEAEYGRTTGI